MTDPVPANLPPDRNPVMDDQGTHIGLARFTYLSNGQLAQLFWPCDGVSSAEWRPLPDLDPPAPDADPPAPGPDADPPAPGPGFVPVP